MVDFKKFAEIDLYKLVGVEFTATEAEVSEQNLIIDKKYLSYLKQWWNLIQYEIFLLDQKILSQESS